MTRIANLICFLTVFSISFPAAGQEWRKVPPPQKPKIAAASNEGELAIKNFKVPEGWKVKLFAAEPEVANPVSFHVDSQGRVFVVESFRQERGVEDNRNHREWLVEDIAAKTIADRLAYIRKHLKDKAVNYTKQADRIRLLLDTDGDGRADKNTIFSSGYNTILSGSGAGVLSYRGNVYFTCIPDLWMLKDQNNDGIADEKLLMSSGYGVRFAFRGHDLHGLIVGPDGRLYFSIGDRGYDLGNGIADPASGAVFRCDLDGQNLEVIATGLRNPQELAFDDYGNLFTGDNNSDSGDKARWVYVVPGGDTGWRMHYQYLPDRGPFNQEKIWHPYDPKTTPAYIVPPVTNLSDGPSGLAYYPGTGLSEHFRGRFFLCDFRGQSSVSGIRTFRVKPKGAFFEVVDHEKSIWQILPTDLQFGPDGKIYISDWVHGWQGEGKGRIYTLSDPKADQDLIAEVQAILKTGVKTKTDIELSKLLGHTDRRVRLEAQFELASRKTGKEFLQRVALNESGELLARLHAIWGWEMIERKTLRSFLNRKAEPVEKRADVQKTRPFSDKMVVTTAASTTIEQSPLEFLINSRNPMVRAEAMRIIADFGLPLCDSELVVRLLADKNSRVVRFALEALHVFGDSALTKHLCDVIIKNDNIDPIIRHAAIMALAKSNLRLHRAIVNPKKNSEIDKQIGDAKPLSLATVAKHENPAVRLVAVVALRKIALQLATPFFGRLQSKLPAELKQILLELLRDKDVAVATEAARAIYDTEHPRTSLEELARQLVRPGMSDAFYRRAIVVNYRMGSQENAERLVKFAADQKYPLQRRVDAIRLLSRWSAGTKLDPFLGHYWPVQKHDRSVAKNALNPVITSLLVDEPAISNIAVEAVTKLRINSAADTLVKIVNDQKQSDDRRGQALQALAQFKNVDLSQMLTAASSSSVWQLRSAALKILAERKKPEATKLFEAAVQADDYQERQAAWRISHQLTDKSSIKMLHQALEEITQNDFGDIESQLDVLLAAKKRKDQPTRQLVQKLERSLAADKNKIDRHRLSLFGGDIKRGRKIFFEKTEVSCLRCHKVNGQGGEVGPDLSEIGKRVLPHKPRNRYLMEAIVDPNKYIAEGYASIVVTDIEGEQHIGIIKEKTKDHIILMDAEGKKKKIMLDDIDEQKKGNSSMPEDIIKKLSREELRDVIAYLESLQEEIRGEIRGESSEGRGKEPLP